MRTYLYLIAWVSGSHSADKRNTRVHNSTDLMPQFLADNESILAVKVNVLDGSWTEEQCEDMVGYVGSSHAFHEGYNSHDSTSIVEKMSDDFDWSKDQYHTVMEDAIP